MIYWKHFHIISAIVLAPATNALASDDDALQAPNYKIEETLASYRGKAKKDYLAFPSIISMGDNQIMLSYKRGEKHLRDLDAELEIVRFDLANGTVTQLPIRIGSPGAIMQMGEWIQFPNGTLSTYVDVQTIDSQGHHFRLGLMVANSADDGKTFSNLSKVGLIDGVEYGYLFDSVTIDKRVYALAMTFEYLTGGRRSVEAIYTDDSGKTWHFLRNLSHEFGDIRINESSLIPYGNGFIIATRGYDDIQRLHKVDPDFKLIQESNITEQTPSISSHIGRPRLFTYEGEHFLIGRNWRAPKQAIPMELALFRFDPENLSVERHYVLDNIEQGKITDGYYPCPILLETDERTILNVFDYRAILGDSPDIMRFQFDSAAFLK